MSVEDEMDEAFTRGIEEKTRELKLVIREAARGREEEQRKREEAERKYAAAETKIARLRRSIRHSTGLGGYRHRTITVHFNGNNQAWEH